MPATDTDVIRNIVVIVARKADYLRGLFRLLETHFERIKRHEERLLRAELHRLVAMMEPRFFTSKEERAERRLNPQTVIEDLDLDALWLEMKRHL